MSGISASFQTPTDLHCSDKDQSDWARRESGQKVWELLLVTHFCLSEKLVGLPREVIVIIAHKSEFWGFWLSDVRTKGHGGTGGEQWLMCKQPVYGWCILHRDLWPASLSVGRVNWVNHVGIVRRSAVLKECIVLLLLHGIPFYPKSRITPLF